VPPVRPSPVVTADVEAVLVALAQPKGDTSSGAGRAPGAVGGAAVVVDAEATRATCGVEGATWGIAKLVGTAQGATEVGKAGDKGAAQVLAFRSPRVAV
jgi:hypothetical protein